jgi:hypothetical protein
MRGGRIKENDGGGEFNYDYIVRMLVNVAMYTQYNSKNLKTQKTERQEGKTSPV